MRRVLLVCSAGMSTSLLVNNIKKAAEASNIEIFVEAQPVSKIEEFGPKADCVLLGPQVRYELNRIKTMYPDKPVASMDMQAYGTMNGGLILKQIAQLFGEE